MLYMEDTWLKNIEMFKLDKDTCYCLCCIVVLHSKFIGLMNSGCCFQLCFDRVCMTSSPLYELCTKLSEIIKNE